MNLADAQIGAIKEVYALLQRKVEIAYVTWALLERTAVNVSYRQSKLPMFECY